VLQQNVETSADGDTGIGDEMLVITKKVAGSNSESNCYC
jgi:hypothetical protein